ncbi:MAG: hypothetical protein OEM95_02715 [Gammaproteobacteria bacterium]|nr:hypothetical protein [Gammaproteobacteria bacterium]MDH3371462.1 hypothetical protein [Gammaproteobacteria bacterium]
MRFNLTALSVTAGLIWGGAILLVALANLVWPSYGRAFLELVASLYPGYGAGNTLGQAIVGTLYGGVDGAIAGFLFGWLYNFLSPRLSVKTA